MKLCKSRNLKVSSCIAPLIFIIAIFLGRFFQIDDGNCRKNQQNEGNYNQNKVHHGGYFLIRPRMLVKVTSEMNILCQPSIESWQGCNHLHQGPLDFPSQKVSCNDGCQYIGNGKGNPNT